MGMRRLFIAHAHFFSGNGCAGKQFGWHILKLQLLLHKSEAIKAPIGMEFVFFEKFV